MLRRALDQQPGNSDLKRALAEDLMMSDKLDEALNLYKELSTEDPKDEHSLLRMSQIYRQKRDFPKARETSDKAKAIASFIAGTDGFKDRDLYPFCFNIADGVTQAAPPSVRGKDVRTLKDATGKAFGEDLYKAVQEGKVNEVSYMFPRPGTTEPVAKVSFVTKAGDQGCGVGYYK